MLRLRFPGAALLLTLAAANPLMAQTAAPAAAQPAFGEGHIKAARDLVLSSGIAASFQGLYPEFRERMRQSMNDRSAELKKDLEGALDSLKAEADKRVDDMVTSAARAFAKELSEADLKEVANFFNSPVGKRYTGTRATVIDNIYSLLQPWSVLTSESLFNSLRAEMKKKGHDI
jgi:uncharacterized protein